MAKKKAKKKTAKKVVRSSSKKTAKKVSRKTPVDYRAIKNRRTLTRPLAVVAFLLNVLIFVLPGIGSLIGGKTKQGVWQIILAVIGIIISMTVFRLLGFPIVLVAWIWGIVTGIEILRESE